jgi:hypothetical protein
MAAPAATPVDVSPFAALPDQPTGQDWADLAALAGPRANVVLVGLSQAQAQAQAQAQVPAEWQVVADIEGVQLVAEAVAAVPDKEAIRLTATDVPDMLALIERTRPGPFLRRTIELGSYLGLRRHGSWLLWLASACIRLAGVRSAPCVPIRRFAAWD